METVLGLIATVITIILGVSALGKAAIRAMKAVLSNLREMKRQREAELDLAAVIAREAERQSKLAAARQKGYEELKLMALG